MCGPWGSAMVTDILCVAGWVSWFLVHKKWSPYLLPSNEASMLLLNGLQKLGAHLLLDIVLIARVI